MLVKISEREGPAGGVLVTVEMSVQDRVEASVLQELFQKVPATVKAILHLDRQGECTDATLWLHWPKAVAP